MREICQNIFMKELKLKVYLMDFTVLIFAKTRVNDLKGLECLDTNKWRELERQLCLPLCCKITQEKWVKEKWIQVCKVSSLITHYLQMQREGTIQS